jgi:hypothetical protein
MLFRSLDASSFSIMEYITPTGSINYSVCTAHCSYQGYNPCILTMGIEICNKGSGNILSLYTLSLWCSA